MSHRFWRSAAILLAIAVVFQVAPAAPAKQPPAKPPEAPAAAPGAPAPAQQAGTGSLINPGETPELMLLYTGDVIGFVEPCG